MMRAMRLMTRRQALRVRWRADLPVAAAAGDGQHRAGGGEAQPARRHEHAPSPAGAALLPREGA
eukprot:92550-Prorocentrum_minimum.AAC.2